MTTFVRLRELRRDLPITNFQMTNGWICLAVIALCAGCQSFRSSEHATENLKAATAVTVANLTDNNPPITITDSNTVESLATIIQTAPGKWKKGSFTAPAGYVRFAFSRDSKVLGVIGLGDQFLVRGGGAHWEFKDIPKELEAKIAKMAGFQMPVTL